jgi:hypothetical protein
MPPGADRERFLESVLEFGSYLIDGRYNTNVRQIGRRFDEIVRALKSVLAEHAGHRLQL